MLKHLRFVAVLSGVSFVFHALWEVAQLYAGLYVGYEALAAAHSPLWFYATVGDVFYTLLALGVLLVLRRGMGARGVFRIREYFYLACIGAVLAVFVEYKASLLHLWGYSTRMPLVPYLHMGVSPLLQMTLLVPLSLYITSLLCIRRSARAPFASIMLALMFVGIPLVSYADIDLYVGPAAAFTYGGVTTVLNEPYFSDFPNPQVTLRSSQVEPETDAWTVTEIHAPFTREVSYERGVFVLARIDPATGFLDGGVAIRGQNYDVVHTAFVADATTTHSLTFPFLRLSDSATPSGRYVLAVFNMPEMKIVDTYDPGTDEWTQFFSPFTTDDLGLFLAQGTLGENTYFNDLQETEPFAFDYINDGPPPPPACTSDCNDNVLFIPGFEASRLYEESSGDDGKIWEPGLGDEAPKLFLRDGGAGESNLYTKKGDVIDTAYGLARIYQSLLDDLAQLKTAGHINDYEALAYDWRLDYQDLLAGGKEISPGKVQWRGSNAATSTPYIVQTLRALAASSKGGKVTIIAHSNGGLLAKALTQYLGADANKLIDQIIFVAVPQAGTPKAIAALLHGADTGMPLDAFPVFFSKADGRAVGNTLQSAFNLLPSPRYLESASSTVVSFATSTLPEWSAKYGSVSSWNGLRAFMTDMARTDPAYSDLDDPEIVSPAMMDRAMVVHRSLDSWHAPTGVRLISIAGWGVPTLSGIQYEKVQTCLLVVFGNCIARGSKISFKTLHTIDGDDTVVEPSAHWGGGTQYWLNLRDYNDANPDRGHKDILEVPQILTYLNDLITQTNASLPQYISTTVPSYTGNAARLEFTAHSPVTLGFQDINGSYMGSLPDGSVTGNLPDVYYERYGDVQWLSIPANQEGALKMQGTGAGSYTLEVDRSTPSGTESVEIFSGVPTDTDTVSTLLITSGAPASSIQVDTNGDGHADKAISSTPSAPVTISSIKSDIALARSLGWINDNYMTTLTKWLDPLPVVNNPRIGNTKLKIKVNAPPPPALELAAAKVRAQTFIMEIKRARLGGTITDEAYQMLLADAERFISQ